MLLCNVKCRTRHPQLVDIAPTVLKAMGMAAPPEMDGTSVL